MKKEISAETRTERRLVLLEIAAFGSCTKGKITKISGGKNAEVWLAQNDDLGFAERDDGSVFLPVKPLFRTRGLGREV